IFRIASSGISQLVTKSGQTKVQASFPGEGETLVGTLALASRGSLPLDRWLAPLAVVITAFAILVLAIRAWTCSTAEPLRALRQLEVVKALGEGRGHGVGDGGVAEGVEGVGREQRPVGRGKGQAGRAE